MQDVANTLKYQEGKSQIYPMVTLEMEKKEGTESSQNSTVLVEILIFTVFYLFLGYLIIKDASDTVKLGATAISAGLAVLTVWGLHMFVYGKTP